MSAAQIDAYFDKQTGAVSDIALALRARIEHCGTHLTCKLAWGFPCWSGNERIFSIIAHKDRCNLQLFSGNRLAEDWPGRIEGTGKQLRHVKIRSVTDVDDELEAIIKAAVLLDLTDPEKVR